MLYEWHELDSYNYRFDKPRTCLMKLFINKKLLCVTDIDNA